MEATNKFKIGPPKAIAAKFKSNWPCSRRNNLNPEMEDDDDDNCSYECLGHMSY